MPEFGDGIPGVVIYHVSTVGRRPGNVWRITTILAHLISGGNKAGRVTPCALYEIFRSAARTE